MSSPDPKRVREALEQHRDGVAGTHQYDELAAAARAWLAGSSPDYEAALKVLIAEDVHEASGLTMTGVRKAVNAAFPGLTGRIEEEVDGET